MNFTLSGWKRILQHNDVLLAVGVVLIISMLLVPLPPLILDILLTVNIALSFTILLVTLYTKEPLQYSTFPTMLLIATLFRLGLNVSSTRLILLYGEAGEVIHAFGNFVIGGNYVVGLVLFVILIIINFIVITNGAGRVSEVSARFTLDAMPGKQLSIDADLNAGLIDNAEAKRRRVQIQREAEFYGTMDGASKFVKGDAIAGIVITVINIVGGFIIGVAQLGMPFEQAATTYTILTVGDGLVSQMPALIISTATGILVTRVTDEDTSLGDNIGIEMFNNPKVLGIMGGILATMGLIPGMPNIPFLAIGGVSIFGAMTLGKQQKQLAALPKPDTDAPVKKSDNVMDLLTVETLELEMGYRLVPLIEGGSGDLLQRIAQIRRQIATDLGFVLPSVRVRDNLQLSPNQYHIKLRGITIETGEVQSDLWLAMSTDPDFTEPLDGIQTKEPAFGLPAVWITEKQKEEAEVMGYTVVSPSAVVSTHLSEIIKRYAPDILSRSDVQELLENVRKNGDPLLADVVPDQISLAELQVVLQNLLRERISVRDMGSILESVGYHSRVSKDPDYLSEQARVALSRGICKQHQNPETGELPVLTLSPEVEDALIQNLMEESKMFALSPVMTQNLIAAISQEVERIISTVGVQPVVLCHGKIRLPLRRLTERSLAQIAILSYNEIGPTVRASAVGSIRLS
jgi:flagellar biosynthesis protein FlhA